MYNWLPLPCAANLTGYTREARGEVALKSEAYGNLS